MALTVRPHVAAGIAVVGAGLIVVTPVAPSPPNLHLRGVQLTSNDTDIVDSPNHLAGLIVGGTGTPIPQLNGDWVNEYNTLYIQRILPGADSEGVFTPEGASPIFSGVKSLPLDTSIAQGAFMGSSTLAGHAA